MKLYAVLPLLLSAPLLAAESNPNRFSFGARLPFNVRAKFSHTSALQTSGNPGPATGGGLDRNYDDGYVRRDSEGGNVTWNWGYQNGNQIQGDTLRLHSTSGGAASRASRACAGEPDAGFEFAWRRDLHRTERGAWGLLLAFNYADLRVRDRRPLDASLQQITDTYALGGIIPPGAPGQADGWWYRGNRDTPGPVIDDAPVQRDVSTVPGRITGWRGLDTDLYGGRLGAWAEAPLTKRLSVAAGFGMSIAYLDTQFRFNETTEQSGITVGSAAGSRSQREGKLGAYIEARFTYALSDRLGVFTGAEYQNLGSIRIQAPGQTARLQLDNTWIFHAGLSYSF